MTQSERLSELFAKNKGILPLSLALENGICKRTFYDYVKKENIERISRGVYASEDAWQDAAYMLHLRCQQGIFSHETALCYHELTDREPVYYTLTVKTGYNPSRLQRDGVKVYTVKSDLHSLGVVNAVTPFGHTIPVYDRERTICDVVRSRSKMEMQDFRATLQTYARSKAKDLHKLMSYASLLGVERILRKYLEVLL